MKQIVCLCAALLGTLGAASAQPPRAEVLVLGVYHMANPGRDIFNTQVDDVLAPKRQEEIAALARVLHRQAQLGEPWDWAHLGWLRSAIAGAPNLRLRSLAEFAR